MPAIDTLHAFLKASSMARHDSTEAAMGSIGFSALSEYISFLRIQATSASGIELALCPYQSDFSQNGLCWTPRAHLALADLASLDATAPPPVMMRLDSFNQAIGAAYTLEGSRLGNAMLFRQLQTQAPDLAARASSFLGFPAVPGFWRQFTNSLNAQDVDRNHWPDILEGSVRAFEVFQRGAEAELQRIAQPVS